MSSASSFNFLFYSAPECHVVRDLWYKAHIRRHAGRLNSAVFVRYFTKLSRVSISLVFRIVWFCKISVNNCARKRSRSTTWASSAPGIFAIAASPPFARLELSHGDSLTIEAGLHGEMKLQVISKSSPEKPYTIAALTYLSRWMREVGQSACGGCSRKYQGEDG